jgi:chaperonin GroEL
MLTTEALIAEKPKKEEAAPKGGGGGGMGGMGGMGDFDMG